MQKFNANGKRWGSRVAALACGMFGMFGMTGSFAAAQGQFVPAWSDEFSGTSVSGANWFSQNVAWPYNAEQQYYLPQQASVSNGELIITSTNQAFGGRPYRSARLETVNRHSWLYGRFEMRAKLPGTQGIWPAFWLLPQDGVWPPEIDIMEFLGHQPTKVYGTNHWPIPGQPGVSQYETHDFVGPNFTNGYNTFRCDWWPDRVEFYVNDTLFATNRTAVPQVPMFVILNTAVGGTWPGNPNASTVFPQQFKVDYVRVSQWNQALLKNPGAEYEGSATRILHWQQWGNMYYSSQLSHARVGQRSRRMAIFPGPTTAAARTKKCRARPGKSGNFRRGCRRLRGIRAARGTTRI